MADFLARILRRGQPAARFSEHDIESLDHAQSKVRTNGVRTFVEAVPRFAPEEAERMYESAPLLYKGVNRKARDAIKKGFAVVPDNGNCELQRRLNKDAAIWMRQTAFKAKAAQALREMFVFGDGFLELGFDEPKRTPGSQEPPKNAAVSRVYTIDPLTIRPVKDPGSGEIVAYLNGEGARDVPRGQVQGWLAGRGSLPKGFSVVHPARIVHFFVNGIREDPDGLHLSAFEVAYISALAKLAGDLSTGDVLEWYSKGFYVLNVEQGNLEDLKAARKLLDQAKNARKNHFVGTERHKFDIKSPLLANLKPFYEAFYIEFAAVLEMPVMLLLGVQKGTVTGSEVDLLDYYDDMATFQELLLDAPVFAIMSRVLKRSDFAIQWVPLYVNKETQANIRFKDAQSATQLVGGEVLTKRQAVRFMRSGELPSPEEVPDEYVQSAKDIAKQDDTGAEAAPPRGEPTPEPEEESLTGGLGDVLPLSDVDRARIAHERALGERILREQGG